MFRPLWCAVVFSPAAAVSAAVVSAVGSAKVQKKRTLSILTQRTSRQRSENMKKVRAVLFLGGVYFYRNLKDNCR